ncbi:MAG: cation:proton antiporter [Lacibacter sp.]|jgi:Kef-type K+ transport system membrane component KefB
MELLRIVDFSLPLKNPVLIFSLILFIILFAPLLLNKLRIPHLIGLIVAGTIIGPHGLNLMLRDSSIVLFGTVGLLYIMFLAGIEIDLQQFRRNSGRSLVFGLYTFLTPMVLGTLTGVYVLQFSLMSSVLLASMFASHTLLAYPIVNKLGIVKNRAVTVTIGGTMITDTLALLVLAVIADMATGKMNDQFWWRLGISFVLFAGVIMLLFPVMARWFLKRYDDKILQYIFVLAMVFLGAFLAEAAGFESIIGAFLAGLALNRLVPHSSPLMNRIEFVGNALFIPFFLIGVGMLVDLRVFVTNLETIKVAVSMIVVATLSKYIAAWLTQKTFSFTADERRVIFGLSNAQAAATLAAVLVGYNIILNKEEIEAAAALGQAVAPVRLLNDAVLNGTILMILVTCTIASFATQKGARQIALAENSNTEPEEPLYEEKFLIAVNSPDTAERLVQLSLLLKSGSNTSGLYALHVMEEAGSTLSEQAGQKLLDRAASTAAAADNRMHTLLRYDINTVNAIVNVVREHKITDLILGLHLQKGITDRFLGNLTEGILSKSNPTTFIYKPVQPLNTINRHLIVVPERAEREIGFPFWLVKLWNLSRNTGAELIFYASGTTLTYLQQTHQKHKVTAQFKEFAGWEDFLILRSELRTNDNLVVIMSRKYMLSHDAGMAKVPALLNKYFSDYNYLLIYPVQAGATENQNMDFKDSAVLKPIQTLDEIGNMIGRLFRRK